MEYKTGEHYWFFDGKAIHEFILTNFEKVWGYPWILIGYFPGQEYHRVRIALPYLIFDTREALCEHYRKIFE